MADLESNKFPELNYESACRVCQLRDSYPDVLTLIHKLRIEENKGWSYIFDQVKLIWRGDGDPPSMSSIRRHFVNEHVKTSNYVWPNDSKSLEARILSSFRIERDSKDLVKKREQVRTPVQDLKSELDTLWNMQNTMTDLSVRMDSDPRSFFTENGNVNKDALNAWVNLLNANRQTISEIRKIRESEQLTSYILQKLLILYTKKIGNPISDFIFEMAQEIQQLEGSTYLQERSKYFLDEGFMQLLIESADESLSDIRSEFRLPTK